MHCDTILAILRGKEQGKEISLCKNNLNVDLERMKKGDYLIQNFAIFLDLEDPILAHLDYVIASIHKPVKKPGTKEENTRTYLNAMKNPYVTIIGHCDDVKYPVDYLAIVRAAMEHQILLEINNSSLSPDGYRGDTRFNDLMILNLCRHFHYPILLSSDSHGTKHVGDFTYAQELLKKADFPKSLVLNNSASEFQAFLQKRKRR